MRFIGKNNNVVNRTLVRFKHHSAYNNAYPDLCVGILDSDVPTNTISFAKVLPDNFQNYFGTSQYIPALRLDQEEKALIGDLKKITAPSLIGSNCTSFCAPVAPALS